MCSDDLKSHLEGMIDAVFGPVEKKWVDAYFPFTGVNKLASPRSG